MNTTRHLLFFVAGLLLFTGCSRKETFLFSKATNSYGFSHTLKKKEILPDSAAMHFIQQAPEVALSPDSCFLTALADPRILVSNPSLQQRVQPLDLDNVLPTMHQEWPFTMQTAKTGSSPRLSTFEIQIAPEGEIEENKKAKTSMMFSLLAAAFVILGVAVAPILIPLGTLSAIIGLISSGAALSEIKKSPKTFSGKEEAQAARFISFTVLVVVLVGLIAILSWVMPY